MQKDYYQSTLYPLQDKVLSIVSEVPVGFYLTGGTALSRAFLHHRYSDDLDFFVNDAKDFKNQVNLVLNAIKQSGLELTISTLDDSFARLFINHEQNILKLDLVNDVSWRSGQPIPTDLFYRTDTINNILSNKITALSRCVAKDVIDIIYICQLHDFNWNQLISEAVQKDLWVNEVEVAQLLEQFPISNADEIIWVGTPPTQQWISDQLNTIIGDVITGRTNSLKISSL
jgi:hypothetical protein